MKETEQHKKLTGYLQSQGIEHFTGREVCTMRRAGILVDAPPEEWWPRIVPALKLAEDLREMLGHPLIVGNGYRPAALNRQVGGSQRSRHITFHAVDLDLPRSHSRLDDQIALYREAVLMFDGLRNLEPGGIGLGLYGRRSYGTRVHIDAGSGRWRDAVWSRTVYKAVKQRIKDEALR